jgi:hypothetical protein
VFDVDEDNPAERQADSPDGLFERLEAKCQRALSGAQSPSAAASAMARLLEQQGLGDTFLGQVIVANIDDDLEEQLAAFPAAPDTEEPEELEESASDGAC